jgi:hypothetical protein
MGQLLYLGTKAGGLRLEGAWLKFKGWACVWEETYYSGFMIAGCYFVGEGLREVNEVDGRGDGGDYKGRVEELSRPEP